MQIDGNSLVGTHTNFDQAQSSSSETGLAPKHLEFEKSRSSGNELSRGDKRSVTTSEVDPPDDEDKSLDEIRISAAGKYQIVASSHNINSLCHLVSSNGSDMESDKATSNLSKANNAAVLSLKIQLSNAQAL
jgi:hypothetical protein